MVGHVTWFGHGTVGIEMDGARLLTDPLLRARVAHLRRHAPVPMPGPQDAVLITHLHRDHLDLSSLRRVEARTPAIVPRGAGRYLARRGFDVVEVGVGDEVAVGGLIVLAVPAVHDGARGPLGPHAPALGFVVSGSRTVYHAGDTDLFDGMAAIGAGGVDVALLPIWGWGSTLGAGHLDPARAATAAALLAPGTVVPIHFGTYAPQGLGRARPGFLDTPLPAFLAAMAESAPGVRVAPLAQGERLLLG
jgi:L-ascorbate metabolism protein UlaG (beta-lactamase superfamily)